MLHALALISGVSQPFVMGCLSNRKKEVYLISRRFLVCRSRSPVIGGRWTDRGDPQQSPQTRHT